MNHLCLSLFFFITFSYTLPAQINWQHTNGPEGGTFYYIYTDGAYAFVADEYKFFRTQDGFQWEQLPHGNLWPVAASPTKLAAGQGFGHNTGPATSRKFVVSYDHGLTWLDGTMPPTKYGYFSSLAVCTHGIYVPDGANSKMYRSQDDGLTWDTIAPPGPYCYDVWAQEDQLYADWYSKIWRLGSNGADWEEVSPVFGNGDYPYNIYVADSLFFIATEINLWCSKDYGTTWKKTGIPFHNSNDNFARVGNRIYRGAGTTGIMFTDDFGSTWHELPIPNDHNAMDLGAVNGELLCGTYNQGVLRLDAPNNVLVPTNKGLNSAAVYYFDSGAGNLWAACGSGVFAYDIAQQQWLDKAPLPLAVSVNYDNVAVSQAGHIAAAERYSNRLYLSTDAGASWDTIYPFDAASGWGYVAKINWLGDAILINGHFAPEGVRSDDLGQTWEQADVPIDIVPFNGKYYGLQWASGLVSSSDFGLSWQTETSPLDVNGAFALYATDERLFYLGYSAQSLSVLYTSTDGASWQYANDGLPNSDFWDISEENYHGNIWRKGDKHFFHEPSIGFFVSLDTCKTWLPLERNRFWRMHSVDTVFYGGSFGGGVLKSGIPQNYGARSRGLVYSDENNNGMHESAESVLPHVQVQIKEPGAWYPYWFVSTQPDGRYSIGSTPGSMDTLRVKVHSNYVENINPPQHIVNGSSDGRDFGVHFKANVTDVSIGGHYAGRPRPGFNLSAYLFYSNVGTLPADGRVALKLDPLFHFGSADPVPTNIFSNDSLVWDFSQMNIFEHRQIQVSGKLDSTAGLGSSVKMRGHIFPNSADSMLADNHFILSDTVVGSYDPNEKRVEPARGLTANEIAGGKELLYTVQFQNTGTFQADRVRIADHLDTALNANTLRLVAASHPVSTFRLLPGGLLEIIFDPIALPDSNSNEPASHGFVTFAIQRNKAYHSTYKIENKASIYFDFNEPIITNTVITPLATPTVSSHEPTNSTAEMLKLIISPNPANQQFTVKDQGMLSGAGELAILDISGKICSVQKVQDWSKPILIHSSSLGAGPYLVRATDAKGTFFGKLVIVR